MAKLKLELTREGAEADEAMAVELSPEHEAELRKMEERELGIRRNIGRRRRCHAQEEASAEEVGQWSVEADSLSAQIGKRRQELETALENKRRKG